MSKSMFKIQEKLKTKQKSVIIIYITAMDITVSSDYGCSGNSEVSKNKKSLKLLTQLNGLNDFVSYTI